MLSAVSVPARSQVSRCFLSLLAATLWLAFGAYPAAAQNATYYADSWTPKNEKFSLHLHAGMFSPIDVNAPSPTVGLRLSKLVGGHLQVGGLTGWTLERKDLTEKIYDLPGSEPEILLARVDEHLIPLMGFLRVNFTEKHWLVPYFGVGMGYEWLTINATDYTTQQTGTAQYSNWAWEGWGGMGIRLDKTLRVNGEVYYNGASLERDVIDQNNQVFKEVIKLDGVGARVGLDIIFE